MRYKSEENVSLKMGNGDTKLYTKEILEDLLPVVCLNLLKHCTAHVLQNGYGYNIVQEFVGDPWRALINEK